MEGLLLATVGMLSLLALSLAVKVRLLRKSIEEISEAFRNRVTEETNALIDISSRDPGLLALASGINAHLRRLRADRHRYQQGDRELKEAVANLSHDLRTPLTAIMSTLDLLDREKKSDAVEHGLCRIRNRAEALTRLTEELLRYSLVASAQALKPERMNLVGALEESLVSFYEWMVERGVQPQISLPEAPVWRDLDRSAVSRVFSNVIGNALKYSDGDLWVTMGTDGTVKFENTAKELDAVAVGRLFDRYYTVQAGRDSTGLGLAIAKNLTERMGGRIEADLNGDRLKITVSL